MSDFLTIQQKIDYARRDFIEISGGTNNSVSWDKSGIGIGCPRKW
jgi:hypothetical protein